MPAFQRTHVTTNAIGLLLQYALDLPVDGGLGLRRVRWQCNSANIASARVAERIGFRYEALLKWDRIMHGGWKTGKAGNNRTMPRGCGEPGKVEPDKVEEMGRDTIMLSICWDDWEDGGREKVKNLIERQ